MSKGRANGSVGKYLCSIASFVGTARRNVNRVCFVVGSWGRESAGACRRVQGCIGPKRRTTAPRTRAEVVGKTDARREDGQEGNHRRAGQFPVRRLHWEVVRCTFACMLRAALFRGDRALGVGELGGGSVSVTEPTTGTRPSSSRAISRSTMRRTRASRASTGEPICPSKRAVASEQDRASTASSSRLRVGGRSSMRT